jgi:Mor family transcriptional regulator
MEDYQRKNGILPMLCPELRHDVKLRNDAEGHEAQQHAQAEKRLNRHLVASLATRATGKTIQCPVGVSGATPVNDHEIAAAVSEAHLAVAGEGSRESDLVKK